MRKNKVTLIRDWLRNEAEEAEEACSRREDRRKHGQDSLSAAEA